jgi:hypothetical protein
MLCDRCVLNGKCELLVPGGECAVEKSAYEAVISELIAQYDLEGSVDEILVERVAMYLIRLARAEVYEANVGVSTASMAWGKYIAGLDKELRTLLRELALTKASRKSIARNDVLTDVDDLLTTVVKKVKVEPRIFRRYSPSRLLLNDWDIEKSTLRVELQRERLGS